MTQKFGQGAREIGAVALTNQLGMKQLSQEYPIKAVCEVMDSPYS